MLDGSIIANSITNPNSSAELWIDNNEPLSFFDYLKHQKKILTPIEFNDAYQQYLHSWYEIKSLKGSDIDSAVRDRYVELLKDISLRYTSAEERRFLSNIDFSNPQDVLIAIPFYSAKIAEICQFYTKKREKIKHKIEDNKIKGTSGGVEKSISNIILDYIFFDNEELPQSNSIEALSAIATNLDIEVEEFFDIYSDYFNIDGDLSSQDYTNGGELRTEYFASNIIDTTENIPNLFLNFDESLKEDIFNAVFTLSGLGSLFTLNISPETDILETENIQRIIDKNEAASELKLDIKKKLFEKYIGTDIYYLSTNSTGTEYVSGILFEAAEPSKNLINSRFSTMATVPSEQLKTIREIGTFFTPDKLGVLHFKTPSNTFKVKSDDLLSDKIYVFPDPEIYGNISNITSKAYEYPLYFVIDNSELIKSNAHSFASNDVLNTSRDQLFYAYKSQQEFVNTKTKGVSGLNSFNYIVNRGVITDWFQDIYGNQYGLIKDAHNFIKNISTTDPEPETTALTPICIVIDGYLFNDGIEGFSFDYSISSGSTFNSSLRTGITARTIDEIEGGTFDTGYPFASGDMFALTGSPIRSLYFREFDPYIDVVYPGSIAKAIVDGEVCDGAGFKYGDGTFLTDPILADDPSFTSSISNYYNTLLEAGLDSSLNLTAVPSGDASFLPTLPISAAVVEINDGGSFLTEINVVNDYPFLNRDLPFYNTSNNFSSTLLDPSTGVRVDDIIEATNNLTGIVFVQDVVTGNVRPLSSIMPSTFESLSSSIRDEIFTNVKWIDINYDTIFIQTENYFVVEKIVYENGAYVSSTKPNLYYESFGDYISFSNPFYLNDDTGVFCKMTVLSATSAFNYRALYPEIYRYDAINHTATKVFPDLPQNTISSLFSLSGLGSVNIIKVKKPDLVYNSRNNIFSITTVIEDGNSLGYIVNYKFKERDNELYLLSSKTYRISDNSISYNFAQTVSLEEWIATTDTIVQDTDTSILYFN